MSKQKFDPLALLRQSKYFGTLKNPDAEARVSNPVCGDTTHIYLRFARDKNGEDVIKKVKIKTYGCIAAIATSFTLARMIEGKSIQEVLKISTKDIEQEVGGLPQAKIHCSLLGTDALREALYRYFKRKKKQIPPALKRAHELILQKQKSAQKKFNNPE